MTKEERGHLESVARFLSRQDVERIRAELISSLLWRTMTPWPLHVARWLTMGDP